MKKQRSVSICTGGGGRALPAKLGIEDTTSSCHPELVSGSIQRCVLPVSLDRFRNKFGMTVKNIPSLRAVADRVAISLGTHHRLSGLPRRSLCSLLAMTRCAGFTMAEILLSLTIIGVVAAITLPSLTGNINERTWNTQRKALYARFSQAIALMPALNGYGTLIEGDSSTSAIDTAAETFITSGLSKVLKINNICDSEHLEDCGLPAKIVPLDLGGSSLSNVQLENIKTLVGFNSMFNGTWSGYNFTSGSYSQLDTKAAAFETANGESILTYYNPLCKSSAMLSSNAMFYSQPFMCANFVYDLNGSKGPNTVGKDIGFISVLYPSDSVVVAPMPYVRMTEATAQQESGAACRALDEAVRTPNIEELAAMFYNKSLLKGQSVESWSSSIAQFDPTRAWRLNISTGAWQTLPRIQERRTRCVYR